MKAMFRWRRCIITSLLLFVFGPLLLVFGLGRMVDFEDWSLDETIAGTFRFGLDVDNKSVLLLIPKQDESRSRLGAVPEEFIYSQAGAKSNGTPADQSWGAVRQLINPRVQGGTSGKGNASSASKKPTGHAGIMASLVRDLDISVDELEADYLRVVNPAADSTSHVPDNRKLNVLIVTNRRSGSSFLGQIFNQHPKLFFQFEPLKLTEQKKELYSDIAQYLRHLAKCEFDQTPHLPNFYDSEPLHRSSSLAMVSPPLCNVSSSAPITMKTVKACQSLETKLMMQVCRSKQYQAIKLIRVYSLSSLEKLALDAQINLKVIHLVRDPRGIHVSKSKLRSTNVTLVLGKSLDHDISYLCRRISRNMDFVQSVPSWLKGKYKLVRYEDIAKSPSKLAQELYDFTGMGPVPPEVLHWIQANTRSQMQDKNRKVYYSTMRNASQISEAWRYSAPLPAVLRMQEFCRETLQDLGYLEVATKQDLLDKDKSLVGKLPVYKLV